MNNLCHHPLLLTYCKRSRSIEFKTLSQRAVPLDFAIPASLVLASLMMMIIFLDYPASPSPFFPSKKSQQSMIPFSQNESMPLPREIKSSPLAAGIYFMGPPTVVVSQQGTRFS
jgi:hypothetical protein